MGPAPNIPLHDRPKVMKLEFHGRAFPNIGIQSVTPFSFTPTMPSAPIDPNQAPWMIGGDPAQPFNLDPSLELLGLNLNEIWGESWELG